MQLVEIDGGRPELCARTLIGGSRGGAGHSYLCGGFRGEIIDSVPIAEIHVGSGVNPVKDDAIVQVEVLAQPDGQRAALTHR